jgi:hypothetical protein
MPEFPAPSKPGDPYRCPRCREVHLVEQPYADATTAAQHYLYVTCRGDQYFVGQVLPTADRRPRT